MATMTDAEILQIAQQAVPEQIRVLGRVVQRHDAPAPQGAALLRADVPSPDPTISDLADLVGAKLGQTQPNSADVEFPEQTALGLRTTVVHVRNGKVARVLKRG